MNSTENTITKSNFIDELNSLKEFFQREKAKYQPQPSNEIGLKRIAGIISFIETIIIQIKSSEYILIKQIQRLKQIVVLAKKCLNEAVNSAQLFTKSLTNMSTGTSQDESQIEDDIKILNKNVFSDPDNKYLVIFTKLNQRLEARKFGPTIQIIESIEQLQNKSEEYNAKINQEEKDNLQINNTNNLRYNITSRQFENKNEKDTSENTIQFINQSFEIEKKQLLNEIRNSENRITGCITKSFAEFHSELSQFRYHESQSSEVIQKIEEFTKNTKEMIDSIYKYNKNVDNSISLLNDSIQPLITKVSDITYNMEKRTVKESHKETPQQTLRNEENEKKIIELNEKLQKQRIDYEEMINNIQHSYENKITEYQKRITEITQEISLKNTEMNDIKEENSELNNKSEILVSKYKQKLEENEKLTMALSAKENYIKKIQQVTIPEEDYKKQIEIIKQENTDTTKAFIKNIYDYIKLCFKIIEHPFSEDNTDAIAMEEEFKKIYTKEIEQNPNFFISASKCMDEETKVSVCEDEMNKLVIKNKYYGLFRKILDAILFDFYSMKQNNEILTETVYALKKGFNIDKKDVEDKEKFDNQAKTVLQNENQHSKNEKTDEKFKLSSCESDGNQSEKSKHDKNDVFGLDSGTINAFLEEDKNITSLASINSNYQISSHQTQEKSTCKTNKNEQNKKELKQSKILTDSELIEKVGVLASLHSQLKENPELSSDITSSQSTNYSNDFYNKQKSNEQKNDLLLTGSLDNSTAAPFSPTTIPNPISKQTNPVSSNTIQKKEENSYDYDYYYYSDYYDEDEEENDKNKQQTLSQASNLFSNSRTNSINNNTNKSTNYQTKTNQNIVSNQEKKNAQTKIPSYDRIDKKKENNNSNKSKIQNARLQNTMGDIANEALYKVLIQTKSTN